MARRTVADQLVEILLAAGVRTMYGVVGDALNPVTDSIRRHPGIDWIHVRHEETGAFAAGAEAQLTGRLGCCAGSSGPGHVHLVNGLYDAHRSHAPVVAIAAHVPSTELGTGYFQETNPTLLFADCSHYCGIVTRREQMARVAQMAVQMSLGRGGVSVVTLPGDVAGEPASSAYLEHTYRLGQRPTADPTESVIAEFAQLVNEARTVTLFCGRGVAGAHDQVIALAEKLKAPVGHAMRGKDWIEYDNPYDVGMSGLLGYGACYDAMQECELLILLGTDFPYVQFMPKDSKVVQVDIARERLGRRSRLDLGVWGDAGDTVRALLPKVAEKTDRSFLDRMLRRHRELMGRVHAYAQGADGRRPIHPEQVASAINEIAADDAVFTVDTGMCNVWAARFIHATGKRRFLGSFNHGTMANALPQSIGAQHVDRNRQVVAICGDGGFTMLMGDFLTLLQYDLPVKVVIFDNSSLAMVELEMLVAGLPPYQTRMKEPDFAAVARAAGATGIRIEDPADVRDGLREAFATPGPVLVDAVTDPNALSMPPKITPEQVKGFGLAFSKIVLSGDFDAAREMARANIRNLPLPRP
ncbi:pyruvate dehydrogenase [Planosporangium flavigriseum]|uniref:Pyruvate dehydrogenase n=1 Tax=Planosporangium flavigriseum TaxID=373681 RepID=A0A8J3PMA1_9ACTN|nr:pyruvate dehydrogenase [Planosporangium flavigriseum]NJC65814.1 pyruvate dehydrogenase [Planosporangium flavigriseum]GIG73668.1 pyruvate dehydrogenase [Planosporangium flavigriseum]